MARMRPQKQPNRHYWKGNDMMDSSIQEKLDKEIVVWGHQGFADIAMIITYMNNYPDDDPVLDSDDVIRQEVVDMHVQAGDLFVTLVNGDIVHYRMTVERI